MQSVRLTIFVNTVDLSMQSFLILNIEIAGSILIL